MLNIYEVIVNFIDSVFQPPISFLQLAIERLQVARMVTAQGLDIGQYFRVFGDLPTAWQMVITSALIATVLLGTLLTFRSIMRLYYAVKEGVHWW
ncbi:hypothetical protein [Amphibacillus cookii]|uniref:hypothetical protein n=1 Tax=Amphibacillus cookii TaxID=767787 RepID=UPI00195DBD1D|nr:hypothetical protein [Amphibacillus cookii]MBM7543258.1 hypothetical protein [Amphibacillus cookii]